MESASEPVGDLLELARRLGPLPYSARRANPTPTYPEAGELARWQVDAVDAWWEQLGRPDPFTVADIGAGDGTRAAAFLAGGPACLTALRYVLVEADASLRAQHAAHLPTESPVLVLGPVGPGDEDDSDTLRAGAGIGPLLTSLAEPPVVEGAALVLAVGWAGRLPSDRLEWRHGCWWDIRLAAPAAAAERALAELPVPLDEERATAMEALTAATGDGARPEGARYARLGPAAEWLAGVLRVAESGRLVVVDRWTDVTRPLAPGEVPPGPRPARGRPPAG